MEATSSSDQKIQPSRFRRRLRLFLRMLVWTIFFLVLLFILAIALGPELFIFQIPYFLSCGWLHYLARVLPMVQVNWGMIFSGVTAFALAVIVSHLVLRWFWHQKRAGQKWRLKWTTSICLLVPVLFGISIAVGGIVHQTAWLMREPNWVEDVNRGRVTRNMSNARQIVTCLRIWSSEHEGQYPERLEQLFIDGALDENRIFYYVTEPGNTPELFEYLHGLNDSDPANIPLVVAPRATPRGVWVMAMNDSSIITVKTEEFNKAISEWRQQIATRKDKTR